MGHESKLSVGDISLLLDLVVKLADDSGSSPSEAIQRIERLLTPEALGGDSHERAAMAEFISRLRKLRLRRNELIGAPLFRDPAWDMLLELFAAHESGRRLSVSSLCYASGVPATTALRQISRLEKHGLVVREGDGSDQRRQFVKSTPKAIAGVARAAALLIEQSHILEAANEHERPDGPASDVGLYDI